MHKLSKNIIPAFKKMVGQARHTHSTFSGIMEVIQVYGEIGSHLLLLEIAVWLGCY